MRIYSHRTIFLPFLVGLISSTASAQLPHRFEAGDVISAAEMNENFAYLAGRLSQQQAQIEQLQRRLDEAPPVGQALQDWLSDAVNRTILVGALLGTPGAVMQVRQVGSVDSGGEVTVPLLPLDQDGRFIIEVLGAHDHQGDWVGVRHIVITGSWGGGGVVANEVERSCANAGNEPSRCSSNRVVTEIHNRDGDAFLDLTISNGEENRLQDVMVIIRGVGEVLPSDR